MLDPRTSLEGSASAIGFRQGVGRPDALAVLCAQSLQSHCGHRHRPPEPVPYCCGPRISVVSSAPRPSHVVAPTALVA